MKAVMGTVAVRPARRPWRRGFMRVGNAKRAPRGEGESRRRKRLLGRCGEGTGRSRGATALRPLRNGVDSSSGPTLTPTLSRGTGKGRKALLTAGALGGHLQRVEGLAGGDVE